MRIEETNSKFDKPTAVSFTTVYVRLVLAIAKALKLPCRCSLVFCCKAFLCRLRATASEEHAIPRIRIGVSSAEALQAVLVTRPELLHLRFVRLYTIQSSLASRFSELAVGKFMMNYSSSNCGRVVVQENVSWDCNTPR